MRAHVFRSEDGHYALATEGGAARAVVGDPRKVAELATRLRPWLARVHAGHSLAVRGAILLGELTLDAEDASRRIQHMMNAADWTAAAAQPRRSRR